MTPEQEISTEDALFDSAIEGPQETAPPAPAEQPKADAAAEQKPPAEQPPPEKAAAEAPDGDDTAPHVPPWRLREVNEEKRAAIAERDRLKAENERLAWEQQEFQRRIRALEQPAQPKADEPDPLMDPKGYREFMERRFDQRLTDERREMSLQMARRTYKEEFDQAYAVAQKYVDPALRARMQMSSDPGETLIQWFREVKVRAEVGNDPAAYKKKVREEFLKDPEFRKAAIEAWRSEASAQPGGRPARLAPSMNGISRSSAALRASQDEVSDDALWDTTTT